MGGFWESCVDKGLWGDFGWLGLALFGCEGLSVLFAGVGGLAVRGGRGWRVVHYVVGCGRVPCLVLVYVELGVTGGCCVRLLFLSLFYFARRFWEGGFKVWVFLLEGNVAIGSVLSRRGGVDRVFWAVMGWLYW